MSKLELKNTRKERTERFLMRKRYLDSTIKTGVEDVEPEEEPSQVQDISREKLEDDARAETRHDVDQAERFWARQKGWTESAKVGAGIIKAQRERENKKVQ